MWSLPSWRHHSEALAKNTVPKRGHPAVHVTKRPAMRQWRVTVYGPQAQREYAVWCEWNELGKFNTSSWEKETKNACRIWCQLCNVCICEMINVCKKYIQFWQFSFLDLWMDTQMCPFIDNRCLTYSTALAPVLPGHSHPASPMP